MKFMVRGEDSNGLFYLGRNGTHGVHLGTILPWAEFDDAHDIVENCRSQPGFEGYVEVVPHPDYSTTKRISPVVVALYLLAAALFALSLL